VRSNPRARDSHLAQYCASRTWHKEAGHPYLTLLAESFSFAKKAAAEVRPSFA